MGLKAALSLAALAALSGCAAGAAVSADQAWTACANDRSPSHHLQVYIPKATVTRVLGTRFSRSGDHEGFLIAVNGRVFKVEDNTDITGPIPLHQGDVVSLLGQFECDDNVIHWTHRDPRGRHPSGYIEVNGQRYQ
jgi:hypothetical protein